MSNYWDERFITKMNEEPKIIFEVGARYGDESIELSKVFNNSIIYSFECNPLTTDICERNLKRFNNIKFLPYGLGDKNIILPFYSYMNNNSGASSFLKRIDFNKTQKLTGYIEIKTIEDIMEYYYLDKINLLCMDVQGYELNVLKGAGKYIKNIDYIIMEQPKDVINTSFLDENMYSKYINAPSPYEIKKFMYDNNFIEIERLKENEIEDNVMYKNLN